MDQPGDVLDFLVHHIVLPPKLPQSADEPGAGGPGVTALLKLVNETADVLSQALEPEKRPGWNAVRDMLKNFGDTVAHQHSKAAVKKTLSNISESGIRILHIKEQNAGLFVQKQQTEYTFSCFELSARTEDVIGTPGSLLWSFPGRTVAVQEHIIHGQVFHEELCAVLEKLCHEPIEEMQPYSRKAKTSVRETRDTPSPAMISEYLMALLAAYGQEVSVSHVEKRIRDDCMWYDAELPWRRSPVWTLVKVSVQLACVLQFGSQDMHVTYKNFMILLIARLGNHALSAEQNLDKVQAISAKLARRAMKLGNNILPFVKTPAQAALDRSTSYLTKAWKETQRELFRRLPSGPWTELDCSTAIQMKNSKESLERVKSRNLSALQRNEFHPACQFGLNLSIDGLPDKASFDKPELELVLLDFEQWVSQNLKVHNFPDPEAAMVKLWELTGQYADSALEKYVDDPEQLSVMLLTTMELWIAIDQLALQRWGLLAMFSTTIPTNFLQPCLLKKRHQLQRLQDVESYMSRRQGTSGVHTIFEAISNECLAVQFYNSSLEHQKLRDRIDAKAKQEWEDKIAEWARRTKDYEDLKSQAERLDCSYRETDDEVEHDPACHKCALVRQAAAMRIEPYEWPLPAGETQARAAVFELDVPKGLAAWRACTWRIVHGLGRTVNAAGQRREGDALSYFGNRGFPTRPHSERIILASPTKSFGKSHYNSISFPVRKECLPRQNAHQYNLYDISANIWTDRQKCDPNLSRFCQTKLPSGPYAYLQWAVDGTSHTSNEAIATQNGAGDLDLHEHYAFASLRSGQKLTWMNISLAIATPDLSLNKEETEILINQASLQAGRASSDNEYREAHQLLADQDFVRQMLDNIESRFEVTRANWKEAGTLFILVNLTTRLSCLAPSRDLGEKARRMLALMRKASLGWARELNKLIEVDESGSDEALKLQLLRAALITKATFDLEIPGVMWNVADVSALVEASVYVYDNTSPYLSNTSVSFRRRLSRDRRMCRLMEGTLRTFIADNPSSFNTAIQAHWPRFPSDQRWTCLPAPNERWFLSVIDAGDAKPASKLHLNLLNGELLVDGAPLSRLPKTIVKNPLYQRLLGKANPRIFLSDDPAMDYMTASSWHGQTIYFALREDELIIQARVAGRALELLPHSWFHLDLPVLLVASAVHWMDVGTGEIEVRPQKEPWSSSIDNWIIRPLCNHWEVRRRRLRLIDSSSQFHQDMIKTLSPLERSGHIVITLSDVGRLQVDLHRLGLKFVVGLEGRLECPKLGAIVDSNQEYGTLIGLESCLVLRNKGERSKDFKRQVLIPYGDAAMTPAHRANHVTVGIEHNHLVQHRLFVYEVDVILGRMSSKPGLARLYMAYLHALTASVSPDPLTGRTGTEEALNSLRSETLLEPPNKEVCEVLRMIQRLSPQREYYPSHLRRMQSVSWSGDASPFTQHESFETLAQKIHESGARLVGFYQHIPEKMPVRSETSLIDRAMIRNAGFRVKDFGGDIKCRSKDEEYKPRDRCVWSVKSRHVHEISSLIRSWRYESTDIDPSLVNFIQGMGTVDGFTSSFNYSTISELLQMKLASCWGSLYNFCRQTVYTGASQLAFVLGMIAFGEVAPLPLKTLASISICEKFQHSKNLPFSSYLLNDGTCPSINFLPNIQLHGNVRALTRKQQKDPSKVQQHSIQLNEANNQAGAIHKHLLSQWPCARPSMPDINMNRMRVDELAGACRKWFETWYRNRGFLEHLTEIQTTLSANTRARDPIGLPNVLDRPVISLRPRVFGSPSLIEAVRNCDLDRQGPDELVFRMDESSVGVSEGVGELSSVLSMIQKHDPEYAEGESRSLLAYSVSKQSDIPLAIPVDIEIIQTNRDQWQQHVQELLQALIDNYRKKNVHTPLKGTDRFEHRTTVEAILQLMRSSFQTKSDHASIMTFAEAIASLQRCQRLLFLAEMDDVAAFMKEAVHGRKRSWSPKVFPEWVALEIENDLAIRPLQARVAMEMISPASGENTTIQLNMGEGKSAVIVHMVAATLANKKQICRLLVLKPLIRQMADLLSKRHQGIASRPIYHLPVSRKTPLDNAMLSKLETLWNECHATGGILLVQPEHFLSFKLMGFDTLLTNPALGERLIQSYRKHRANSRDIIDESDEVLSVVFQLAYAMGTQRHMENFPDRWTCQAAALDIIEKCVHSMVQSGVDGIMADAQHEGSFPFVVFTRKDAGGKLALAVGHAILETGTAGLSFESLDNNGKESVLRFISRPELLDEDWLSITGQFHGSALGNLLVLRGLLARGILLHCLREKRWLVNYGLDPSRSSLAVPYKAKGIPSPQSEFGHPDVAVLFTYLSYYYTGLTNPQLRRCFEMLYKAPDPSQEYIRWVRRSQTLPSDLHDLRAINLEDSYQFTEQLCPIFRFNKKVIDFYAASIAFPAGGKEFAQKLSTSAWDIPAELSSPITTGFSGTNDNRALLPSSISQADLPELVGTNAMVMEYLIRAENRQCLKLHGSDGRAPTLADVLRLLMAQQNRPQVLIDVGALIIESQNEEAAREWLRLEEDMDAALFFDQNHEMIIVDRDGVKERLVDSPYKDCLDKCLVYLDEAHTRGTDLKLPLEARAAVTVSSALPKDRLVQACMRMRKLGHGQSVAFILPQEVLHGIMDASGKSETDEIDSRDILLFCLRQTCANNQRQRALWANYGIGHRVRQLVQEEYHSSTKSRAQAEKDFLEKITETDARPLKELYGPISEALTARKSLEHDGEYSGDVQIQELAKILQQLPSHLTVQSFLHEEQERELDQEVQRIEEKERPPPVKALAHCVSNGLRDIVNHGNEMHPRKNVVALGHGAARACLDKTSFNHLGGVYSSDIFNEVCTTKDFNKTVELGNADCMDFYLRPANFVLTSWKLPQPIIISPFEANELFEDIRKSKHVSLRVYAPRTMNSMSSLDRFGLHTFGGSVELINAPWNDLQRLSLDLFAGQLYFQNAAEYERIRAELKRCSREPCQNDPWQLLSKLTSCRRKGKLFITTHTGALITGRAAKVDDF